MNGNLRSDRPHKPGSERFEQFDGISRTALIVELLNHRKALQDLHMDGLFVLQAIGADDLRKYELQLFSESLNTGTLVLIGQEARDKRLDAALESAEFHQYTPAPRAASRLKPAPEQDNTPAVITKEACHGR